MLPNAKFWYWPGAFTKFKCRSFDKIKKKKKTSTELFSQQYLFTVIRFLILLTSFDLKNKCKIG